MVAQFINSHNNYNYRMHGSKKFYDKLETETLKKTQTNLNKGKKVERLLETEEQILANRRTVYQQKQERRL